MADKFPKHAPLRHYRHSTQKAGTTMLRKLTRRLVLKAIHAAALRIHAHLHHRADAAAKECSTILASTTDPARRNEAVASLEDEMMQLQERHTQIVNILDSVEALQAK